MQEEATQHVLKCSRCLRRKTPPQVAPLQPILVTQPLELVHMDYLSLEPSKGNIENVLVITTDIEQLLLLDCLPSVKSEASCGGLLQGKESIQNTSKIHEFSYLLLVSIPINPIDPIYE